MITGTITPSDYLNAQRLHRKRAEIFYFSASGTAVVIGLVLLATGLLFPGLLFVCGGIGGAVGELVTSLIVLPWKVRRLHSQQKDLASPFTYTWNSEFLEATGVSGESKRAWKNYAKVKENKNVFLLYHADNLFEMLPKTWFTSREQEAEFRELAKNAGT